MIARFVLLLRQAALLLAVCAGGLTCSGRAADWPDPVANDVVAYQASGLTHGPMLGGVTAQSVRVWVRTDRPRPFHVVYDTRLPLAADSPRATGETSAARDRIGVVELGALEPATRYYYGIVIDGALADTRLDFTDPWPSFRTLPDAAAFRDAANPQGRFNICFSIACGASQEAPRERGGHYGSPPGFDTLLRRYGDEVMFHLFNGDTIYEECRDGTREGLRANYRRYLHRGRSMARLVRYVPACFLYDDHEVGWDIHGCGEIGLGRGKHLIRDLGVDVWNEYGGWANSPSRYRAPIRFGRATVEEGGDVLVDPQADFRTLKPERVSTIHVGYDTVDADRRQTGPRLANDGVYGLVEVVDAHRLRVTPAFRAEEQIRYSIGSHHFYDWKVGNCHFFALDTRGERTRFQRGNVRNPENFILGPAQEKWLLDGVRATDAEFIMVISPDPWVIHHTAAHVSDAPEARLDKGDGFPSFVHQRERLLEVLDALDRPVLVFTGDVHNSMCVQISDNVWELMCGPIGSAAHPIATAGDMPFGGWFDSQGRRVKVKWTLGFPNNVHYTRLHKTAFAVVQVNNIMKAARPEGSGYQFLPYDEPQAVVRFHDGHTGRLLYAEAISTLDARRDADTP